MENTTTDTGTSTGTASPANDDIETLVGAEFDAADSADTETVKEEEPARKDEAKEETAEPRLYGGKYRTVEELERAHAEAERKMHEATTRASELEKAKQTPADDDWVDLRPEELEELKVNDPEAHDEYLFESLRRKREAKQGKADAGKKEVEALVNEKLAPYEEVRKEIEVKKWHAREDATLQQTREQFGKDFDTLEKQRQDPKFIGKVLEQSPLGQLIVKVHTEGSPATAHQLLLREIQLYNLRKGAEKSRQSIPADAGSHAPPKNQKPKFGDSIEEAFDLSVNELENS
jgi:hypothetical protein